MVTIGSVPETSGDKSLGDAEDSEDAYPGTGCPNKHGNSVTNSISSFQIIL